MNSDNAVNADVSSIAALGRMLIALIFIRGGINKLSSIAATVVTMRNHGIPYPDVLVWGAIAVELGGGLMCFSEHHKQASIALR
jgi:putative oxidoreductase